MIEFSEHATYTGWNDAALYGEFYHGLLSISRDQLVVVGRPTTFQQLKTDALRCDSHYWNTRREGHSFQSDPAVCLCHHSLKPPGTTRATPTLRSRPKATTVPVWTEGSSLKWNTNATCQGPVIMCALPIDVAAPDCAILASKPLLLVGPPHHPLASPMHLKEVVEEPPMNSGNDT